MNIIQQSVVLYYADFLSLQQESIPVTDNCKYYYIHNVPINSAYIVDREPFYEEDNEYYKKSLEEYNKLKDKFDEEGVNSFVQNICNLSAMGCIDAELMLRHIHQYSSKETRKKALTTLKNWKNNQTYSHLTINDDGTPKRVECTRYIARYEQGTQYDPQVTYTKNNI